MRLNFSESWKGKGIILPVSLFLITVVTRIPFAGKLLYHLDSVQFALALKNYDISLHQPHPPGYFLYVMLGRLFNYFINDANLTFISISIIFSGLTVVVIYYLGKELFDNRIGLIAALLAITSPNLWFHGEIALSYVVEAFFSTAVAFLCWRLYNNEHRHIWLSAVVLGIAGGIRQNTVIFLLPLWLFSLKGVPIRKVIACLGLLGLVCLLWFVPMVLMTGGLETYREAFRQLWLFNLENVSVFSRGWSSFRIFSSALLVFIIYGLGAGVFIAGLSAYSLMRNGKLNTLDTGRVIFFSLWILPCILFYLFMFIHPANPGYSLIFLPALLLMTAASIAYTGEELKQTTKKDLSVFLASGVIIINSLLFLFSNFPVTYREVRNHDRDLAVLLDGIKIFDPSKTAVFVIPYVFFGYRHIMYYLPQYRVYDVDVRVAQNGEIRKTFGGFKGETILSDEVLLPEEVINMVVPAASKKDKDNIVGAREVNTRELQASGISIVSGRISLIKEIFPELRVRLTL